MKKTDITALAKENAFDLIGKKWMLVTAGTKDSFNTMTASWGGIGWLWNKPVAFVFIRPERSPTVSSRNLTVSLSPSTLKSTARLCRFAAQRAEETQIRWLKLDSLL